MRALRLAPSRCATQAPTAWAPVHQGGPTTLNILSLHPGLEGSTWKKVALAAALAVVLCALPFKTVFSDEDRDGRNRHHQDEGRRRNDARRHRHYPVYVPAPIYRPRYESPGIRLVIPFDIH